MIGVHVLAAAANAAEPRASNGSLANLKCPRWLGHGNTPKPEEPSKLFVWWLRSREGNHDKQRMAKQSSLNTHVCLLTPWFASTPTCSGAQADTTLSLKSIFFRERETA